MSILKAKSPRIREKRLDALNAWLGTVDGSVTEISREETVQRIRTFSQSAQDDLIYALRLIAGIRNSVTIIHAPRGCAAAGLFYQMTSGFGRWMVTNLDQRDTIMGADLKLRKAVKEAYGRYAPEVIFIVSGPVAAINNDDIQAVVDELHEELDLPLVPVYVTGFTSGTAVSGYDTALHSILKHLCVAPGAIRRGSRVNLLSVTEHPLDRLEAERLLASLGVVLNVLPDGAVVETFREATGASLSLSLDQDSENYLAVVLRDEYGVPYVDQPRPIGINATARWLFAVGQVLGLESQANALHEREAELVRQALGGFNLEGARVYFSLSSATAFAIVDLVEELGGTVAGITINHLDKLHRSRLEALCLRHPELQLHVAEGQAFEELNIVRRLVPDLYLGDAGHVSQVGRLGIPVVSLENLPVLGYRGLIGLVRRIASALENRSYCDALAKSPDPCKEAWYRRSPNWHIKKEVK